MVADILVKYIIATVTRLGLFVFYTSAPAFVYDIPMKGIC